MQLTTKFDLPVLQLFSESGNLEYRDSRATEKLELRQEDALLDKKWF